MKFLKININPLKISTYTVEGIRGRGEERGELWGELRGGGVEGGDGRKNRGKSPQIETSR